MTSIEWATHSWNFVRGCRRVSPGCGGAKGVGGCYAERQATRFAGPGGPYEGLVQITKQGPRWTGRGRFVPEKLAEPLRKRPLPNGQRRRWFVNSMSDLFFEEFTNEQIAAGFGVMAACPHDDFLILTKRAERLPEWFEWFIKDYATNELGGRDALHDVFATAIADQLADSESEQEVLFWRFRDRLFDLEGGRWPLPNVHLGVSVEDQQHADERVPLLLQCPAAVRFLSVEPMLGPVDLTNDAMRESDCNWLTGEWYDWADGTPAPRPDRAGIDWVVVGGESGPGSRPFDLAWARALRDQCRDAGVAYYFKQVGARYTDSDNEFMRQHSGAYERPMVSRKGGDIVDIPEDLRIREFPEVRP